MALSNRPFSRRHLVRGVLAVGGLSALSAILAACDTSAPTGGSSAKPAATTASGGSTTGASSAAPTAAPTTAPPATKPAAAAGATTTSGAAGAASPAAGATAGAGAAATKPAAASPAAGATGATPAAKPAAAGNFSGKLTAWGIVSFTKDGDALLGQQMADWGKANKVDVEYVPLPGSDYDAKLSAAVESGAIPDVPMMSGQTQYYVAQNRLVDVSDIFGTIKGFGGGMFEQLFPLVQVNGKTYSIPMESDLSVMYVRLDLVEKATGKRESPKTWDEVDQIARKLNDPPKLFGIGFTLGRTPDCDGNITVLLRAEGGMLVDKDGKPAINNDGTVAALKRIQGWWKDGLIPPDSPSWDDSSNNQAYQSKRAVFVWNPASIFAYLDQNDKDLLKNTDQAALPKGKSGTGGSVGTWSWSVFSASKQQDAAKAMIQDIMDPNKIQAVYEKVGGRWYPVFRDLTKAKFWADRPYFNSFPAAIENSSPDWTPAAPNAQLLTQLSAVAQKRIRAEMVQEVVVSNKSPEEAAKNAQTKMEQAFAEIKK